MRLAEGAVLGRYDYGRWRGGDRPRGVERLVIGESPDVLAPVANRAAMRAHWTGTAREIGDALATQMSPEHLTDRVVNFAHLVSEIVDPVRAGLE